jgi:hypothetical protein
VSTLILQGDAASSFDAYLGDGIYANVNFGTDVLLQAGTATVGKSTLHFRSLLRFDLASLPPGSSIVDATLALAHANSNLSTSATFYASRLTQPAWTELGATWNKYNGASNWSAAGGDFTTVDQDSCTISSSTQDLTFPTLANLVVDAIQNRGGVLHLLVRGPEESSGTKLFGGNSSDSASASSRPKLTVNYVGPPTLAIVDNGDGSGATATIGGSEPGSHNVVYTQRFSGDLESASWQVAGTRSGDGQIELALSTGHYFALATSTQGGITVASSVAYFVVTDGVEALHSRCLAAAQARIRLLALAGVENDRVVVRKVPLGRNLGGGGLELPAIVLSPRRTDMPPTSGTNGADDVHYDVLVAIFDRDNQEPTFQLQLDRHLLWREQIARAFRNQRLAGVPEVINAAVEPAEGLLDDAWKHELAVSALLVRFTSRETRGF